ncbi:putative MFS multidrug transporter [Lindgomyces ingoldianus]|uniref:MFS multidrug transporter n=1 Tax=Lindgomyces ingoldianus TaxID=673940 RepID=A0ACB6R033_9PLEO|nr:putative MFS multidrug transporter [Lindgomyces ingoldianus]KAF2472397.1 putative MFS multidrug transporter [Lindgomyces ingoldianus]
MSDATGRPEPGSHLGSLRLNVTVFGLWISLFLSALETSIVSTALLSISSSLHSLKDAGWIVVAYLLTYNSFILVWSKLSDTFGTKVLLILANVMFGVFSVACAVSQTMEQLIIFRALQGIGGSGLYSLVFVVLAKIVPMNQLGLYSGVLSSVFALASLLGPILGGVIVVNTTWRWIFWLNAPGVSVAIALLLYAMPPSQERIWDTERLKRVDYIGSVICIAWAIPFVFALQQGGSKYPWSSGTIIGTLAVGSCGIVLFALHQWWESRRDKKETIFPVNAFRSLVVTMMILSMFALGFSFYGSIITIPQRFQAVNGVSASRAGVLLLPFTLVSPTFALLAGAAVGKKGSTSGYLTFIGGIFTVIAMALLGSLPTGTKISNAQFGYQALLGVGVGLFMPPLMYLLKVEVEDKDVASIMGAMNMARTLGGCIGLAICASVQNADLSDSLPRFLSETQIAALHQSVAILKGLPADLRLQVVGAYAETYNHQFQALSGFAGLGVVTSGLVLAGLIRRGLRKGDESEEDGEEAEGENERNGEGEDTLGESKDDADGKEVSNGSRNDHEGEKCGRMDGSELQMAEPRGSGIA